MTWQRVAALGLLIGGAVLAAALHSELIAATLAGAAAGFAVNRDTVGGPNGVSQGSANHDVGTRPGSGPLT